MKNFLLILVGIVIGGGIFWLGTKYNPNIAQKTKEDSQNVAPTGVKDGSTTKTSLGDSPYLGDKNKAKIAIVEYSDFECPYCKRFHDETFDQIVKSYVDTGKAIITFRNFPLDFHKPAAEVDANAALCVNKIAGREKYFEMVKLIYQNTGLNGKGMAKDKFVGLISQLGVDKDVFGKCFDDNIYANKIEKDIQDGNAAGVNGTPGFIIGKFDKDGNVTGELVSGAQPFTKFQSIIDNQLK